MTFNEQVLGDGIRALSGAPITHEDHALNSWASSTQGGNIMAKDYVEQHDAAYWIAGTRVSLDSVVYAFLEGLSPESIVDSFDTLTLEEVYKRSEAQFDELCRRARAANPLLYRKLDEARQRMMVQYPAALTWG